LQPNVRVHIEFWKFISSKEVTKRLIDKGERTKLHKDKQSVN